MAEQSGDCRADLYAGVIADITQAICQGGTPRSKVQAVTNILAELRDAPTVKAILGR